MLAFNLVGYKCLFAIKQAQASQQTAIAVNSMHYNDNELTVLKVPMSLPYFTNWTAFERYDGSIEIDGHHYEYVKRKIVNDTLILLCLPNAEKDKLASTKSSFEKLISGQSDTNGKRSTALPELLKLLNTVCSNEHHFYLTFPFFKTPQYPAINSSAVLRGTTIGTWQPPDTRLKISA